MSRVRHSFGSTYDRRAIADRLREVREELLGRDSVRLLADWLEIPERTWANYEAGVTIPAEVLLRFLEISGVDPHWLLRGEGYRFTDRWARNAALPN
jgi:hypothetical protein